MSASELFDLIRPAITVLSAIISSWLLFSARKRFPLYQAFAWALTGFFFPFVILPLYLALLVLWRPPHLKKVRYRVALAGLYLMVILTIFGVYTYNNSHTVDAHLSRAALASVKNDTTKAINEYREVLRLEESPHNHKLLANALADAGFHSEAIQEFLAAEKGGEPDDLIYFRLGTLLERAGRKDEALEEYRKFTISKTCQQIDNRCESARDSLKPLK